MIAREPASASRSGHATPKAQGPSNRPTPSANGAVQPAQSPAKVNAPSSTILTAADASDRYRKRGRVESAGNEARSPLDARADAVAQRDRFGSPHRGLTWLDSARSHAPSRRSASLPNICLQNDDDSELNIFPDINPRDLRLAEVRSWHNPWMDREFHADDTITDGGHAPINTARQSNGGTANGTGVVPLPRAEPAKPQRKGRGDTAPPPLAANAGSATSDDFDLVAQQLADELSLEEKGARAASAPVLLPAASPSSTSAAKPLKRPMLRLKLEDMPTPQQAEDRANRAATRIIARREAIEKAMNEAHATGDVPVGVDTGKSATQQAMMRLNFKSYSSGDESDVASPTGRFSVGSAYSPSQGMFTTKMVAVSEAGISSPDSASLHLQENLERVKEIGRGASGVVYKSIHIPTLKVVAVKDVPVYGRGQRRQMVRELHALYSNLVPIANDEQETRTQNGSTRRPSNGRPRASPHIVSFYDAYVDRAKNCICLVMEYMSAGSLQDIVLRGGCQNEKVLSRLAAGVMQGLSHIHSKNMVHRDIKPHNLLTNRQGEVKISDFGLAKTLNDNAGMTKTFVGTLLYMAPERIGGGDYSYPADIWSFGLALVSVALGKYPLPTQDGFFGLVDTVANEQYLNLPEDDFSPECRDFVKLCLKTDPKERPSADTLLHHPFLTKYSKEETLDEWVNFIEASQLCEDRSAELESLGEAVYRHLYERSAKFSFQPQSDYGTSLTGRSSQTSQHRKVSIQPVQMSLQLGLANYLGLPVHQVHTLFEARRGSYNDKLLEDYCFSPQSWTASPGNARRQQLFGRNSESPQAADDDRSGSSSFWKKLQSGLTKLKMKKKKSKESSEGREDRWSFRGGSR